MKKTFLLVLVLAAATAAALFFFLHGKDSSVAEGRAAELAPADTVVFLEVPNVERTLKRWESTSLSHIAQEPEWKEFTAKFGESVLTDVLDQSKLEILEQVKQAQPAGMFVAFTDVTGGMPAFVGGVPYRGKMTTAKAAIEKLRAAFLQGGPPPKSELVKVEGTEVEVLFNPGFSVAFAYRDNWFFFGSSVEGMKGLLQRYASAAGAPASLAKDATFIESTKQGHAESDFAAFVRPKALLARPAGAPPRTPSPLDIFIPDAVHYSLKLDGLLVRGRIYLQIPKLPQAGPLANHLLGATTPGSFGYATLNTAGMDDFVRTMLQVIEADGAENSDTKRLAEKGIKISDLRTIFGPELGIASDWPASATEWPSFFFGVEVRDAAKARLFTQVCAESLVHDKPPEQKEEDGTTYWTVAKDSANPTPLTFACNATHLVFALDPASAAAGIKSLKAGSPGLRSSETFQGALKSVTAPAAGLFYVDEKQLFERLYLRFVPELKTQIAGSPEAAKYLDAAKIPKAETISKHLLPLAVSLSNAPQSLVVDSAGSVPLFGPILPVYLVGFRASPRIMAPPIPANPPGVATPASPPAPGQ